MLDASCQTEPGSGLGRARWFVERTFAWLRRALSFTIRRVQLGGIARFVSGAALEGISHEVPSDFHIELPPDLAQLASLRRSLADWLAREEVGPRSSDAIILATHEAVANAVEHGHAGVVVTGSRDQDRVTVVVRNCGGWKESDESEYRGRGLILMHALMSQVEIASRPDGSVVRMELMV